MTYIHHPGKQHAHNGYVERVAPLTDRQKEMMLMVLCRKESAFLAAKDQLKPEHFSEYESGLATIWSCVLDHYEHFGQLPGEDHLVAEIERRLEEAPDQLSEHEIAQLDQYVERAYLVPADGLKVNVALRLLQEFLREQLALEAQALFARRDTPRDLQMLLSHLTTQAQAIDTLLAPPPRTACTVFLTPRAC